MNRIFTAFALLTLTASGLASGAGVATASPEGFARTVVVPSAVNGTKVTTTFLAAVKALTVASENRAGYERSKFRHWNDVDGDCQNARAEVLKFESQKRTTGKCTIATGKWLSYYDRKTIWNASQLDVDHMVPLAEAWDSGARGWTANRRQAFANDLTERRSLVAVTASTNRSKGDRDPAGWLPQYSRCRYALEWTAVKTRWSLRVDATERRSLVQLATRCSPNHRLTVFKAVVKSGGTTAGGGGAGGGGTGGSCTPGYSPCLPPRSDYDCASGSGNGPGYANGPIYVTGSDPYDLDNDGDGVACEN